MSAEVESRPRSSNDVATEVRVLLTRRGMSLRGLAVLLDVTPMWVTRRVGPSRTTDLTIEDVERIAHALDVTAADLYGA